MAIIIRGTGHLSWYQCVFLCFPSCSILTQFSFGRQEFGEGYGADQELHGIRCGDRTTVRLVTSVWSNELRLVIDLSRNLNSFTTVPPFSYSSVQKAVNLCSKDCWLFKIDLRHAYLSFPVNDKLRDRLTFYLNGRYYQFCALPFGLALAPFYCTCLLEVVEFELRSVLRCSVTSYLDDFLFICPDKESAHIALAASMKIFYDFGLVVNTKKTCFPSQCITFLGSNRLHNPDTELSSWSFGRALISLVSSCRLVLVFHPSTRIPDWEVVFWCTSSSWCEAVPKKLN